MRRVSQRISLPPTWRNTWRMVSISRFRSSKYHSHLRRIKFCTENGCFSSIVMQRSWRRTSTNRSPSMTFLAPSTLSSFRVLIVLATFLDKKNLLWFSLVSCIDMILVCRRAWYCIRWTERQEPQRSRWEVLGGRQDCLGRVPWTCWPCQHENSRWFFHFQGPKGTRSLIQITHLLYIHIRVRIAEERKCWNYWPSSIFKGPIGSSSNLNPFILYIHDTVRIVECWHKIWFSFTKLSSGIHYFDVALLTISFRVFWMWESTVIFCLFFLLGVQCTGFTNAEEEAVQKTKYVPFLLEDKMKENGGLFEAGPNWVSFSSPYFQHIKLFRNVL